MIYSCNDFSPNKETTPKVTSDTMHLYRSGFVVDSPWSLELKKISKGRLDKGWILYEEDTMTYFITDRSLTFSEEPDSILKPILLDTIEDVLLGWYEVDGGHSIELRDLEKGENGAHHYYFFGNIYPEFKKKERLIEFYYKIKRQVLLCNLDSEENIYKQILLKNK